MNLSTRAALSLGASVVLLTAVTPSFADTLADAVARAYVTNPDLRAARAVQKQVDEQLVQAHAQFGPQVTASAGEGYNWVRGAFFHGEQAAASTTAGLQLNQSVYSGGRLHAQVDLATANILAQRESLRNTEIQVLQQVVDAYLAVRRDLATVEVYLDNVQALNRQLEQVRAEFAVRQVTQTDVDQTIGRLAQVQSNLATARAQLETSRSRYLQLVGDNPGELAPEPELAVFADVDQAFTSAELSSPALNAARYQEQAARSRVQQQRAEFLPEITAQLSINKAPVQAGSAALGDQTIYSAGFQATQRLYSSGLYASTVRQAKSQVEEMRARIESARRTSIQAVAQAWSQLVAARAALAADETATKADEAAFYGVRREQPFDLRQPIDVLNAEQELNAAQVRVLQDRYNEYTSRVNLLAAAGTLSPEILASNTPSYRPQDYLNKVKNKGVPFFAGAMQALDSLGIPALPAPAIAVSGPEGRTAGEPALPPAPTSAEAAPPLRTATSIMEAESRENGKTAQRGVAPLGRCFEIGGRKVGDCLPTSVRNTEPPLPSGP